MRSFHWGWRIAVVYTIFAACTLGFVVFALGTRVDLVQDDYYEASLRQDLISAARQHAKVLGAGITAHGHTLAVTMSAAGTGELPIRVMMYKPDNPASDTTIEAKATDGRALVDVSTLQGGAWKVTVTGLNAGQDFIYEQNIVLE